MYACSRNAKAAQVEADTSRYDLAGTMRTTIAATALGSCCPSAPSRGYERSNPWGPVILMSHRSLPCEPTITTRQSPSRPESTCSIIAVTSRCNLASPVLCISTVTAISRVYASHIVAADILMVRSNTKEPRGVAQDITEIPTASALQENQAVRKTKLNLSRPSGPARRRRGLSGRTAGRRMTARTTMDAVEWCDETPNSVLPAIGARAKPSLLGLPCSRCRAYYEAELTACPICGCTERVAAASPTARSNSRAA